MRARKVPAVLPAVKERDVDGTAALIFAPRGVYFTQRQRRVAARNLRVPGAYKSFCERGFGGPRTNLASGVRQ